MGSCVDAAYGCRDNPRGQAALLTTLTRENLVTQTATAANGSGSRRYMLVGDVHLVLVNRAGRVLFGQRQNTGYEDGAWHLPSGHLEAGESVVAALIREAREETGIAIEDHAVEFSHVMHNSSGGGRAAFFFTVRHWTGAPRNREPGKCAALDWFPLDDLPGRLIPYCRTALECIAADHCFSTFGW
jgi:8-oxo-dGTP pyrophosphatase MutT (NUDIX family)